MNFFQHQEEARSKTKLLVFLFILAILTISLAVYAAVALVSHLAFEGAPPYSLFDPLLIFGVSGGTILVILLASAGRVASLSGGGAAVAESLGGRKLDPHSGVPEERQLQNVVTEMAIASGMRVPEVYVLDDDSINAFAAGHNIGDAVIGVTRGAIKRLNRDELQGVIAHEFSHILNGDMKLNIRLMGVIFGILAIHVLGRFVFEVMFWSPRRRRGGSGDGGRLAIILFLLGLLLMIIGWFGMIFGQMIQSAVSRQREFLADASAVQFTRNPGGIGGALRKLMSPKVGSRISHPRAEEVNHMFFGSGVSTLFASHPPLKERITRIMGGRAEELLGEDVAETPPVSRPRDTADLGSRLSGFSSGAQSLSATPELLLEQAGTLSLDDTGYAELIETSLPPMIRMNVNDVAGACATIYALLLDPSQSVRTKQLHELEKRCDPGLFAEVARVYGDVVRLSPAHRLPVVDLCLPTLRDISEGQTQAFIADVHMLIEADEEWSLFEYAVEKLLVRHLTVNHGAAPKLRFNEPKEIAEDIRVVLSTLAYVGASDEPSAVKHLSAGAAAVGLSMDLAPRESCTFTALDAALARFEQAYPKLKQKLFHAMTATVTADGHVTVEEAELLRAFLDTLDCPLPPLPATALRNS